MRIILNGKLPSQVNEARFIASKSLLGETGNVIKKNKAILTKAALSNRANTVSVPKVIAP